MRCCVVRSRRTPGYRLVDFLFAEGFLPHELQSSVQSLPNFLLLPEMSVWVSRGIVSYGVRYQRAGIVYVRTAVQYSSRANNQYGRWISWMSMGSM